ncbi:MAG: hypothetical protein Q9216_003100 [Gyalolechia sp. 2 TL-2023]
MDPSKSLTDLAARPTYSDDQVIKYLDSINIAILRSSIRSKQHNLTFLELLQQRQLSTYPFENLSLHYSTTYTVSLDVNVLYDKYVNKGRGGYCMENNTFFGTVLRSLGFEVTSVGARVCGGVDGGNAESYGSWGHMVNIVTVVGKKYMVDVGFGTNGATAPVLLQDNNIQTRLGQGEMRVAYSKIAQHTDPDQRLWVYQIRHTPNGDWEPMYCFTETEFLPQDYEMMNFWTSQSRRSLFTYTIMIAKMVMEEGRLVGTLTMRDAVAKRRVGNEVLETKTCGSEKERLEVLREWFGIRLTEEEEKGIRGTVAELKG